tara:strand:- start:5 stop:553 length:549 start_codon:yes stop_codon:yes gene_type:complete
MENIPSLYNYLEKYSIFYLSKYIVTKRKFEDILNRKIQRDLFKKKLNYSHTVESRKVIDKLVKKFIDLNIINEERQITLRIESLILKGFSIKKIFYTLLNDLFSKELINKEIEKIKEKKNFEFVLIHNFCVKKKIMSNNNTFQFNNKDEYNKVLRKLIREGFDVNLCRKFINQTAEIKKIDI